MNSWFFLSLIERFRGVLAAYPRVYAIARIIYRRVASIHLLGLSRDLKTRQYLVHARPDLVIDELILATRRSPRSPLLWTNLAIAQEGLHWWPEAFESWRKVLDCFPDSVDAALGIARGKFEQGFIKESQVEYEKVAARHVNISEPILAQLEIAQRVHDWCKAELITEQLRGLGFGEIPCFALEARLLTAKGNYDAALAICREKVELKDIDEGCLLRIDILLARRFWEEALELIESATCSEHVKAALFNKRQIALRIGRRYKEAIQALENLEPEEREKLFRKVQLAQLYVLDRQDDKAIREISAIPEICSRHRNVADLLSWKSAKLGNIEESREHWHTVAFRPKLQSDPKMSEPIKLIHWPGAFKGGAPIKLVTLVRNEVLRLPFFLDYYRRLGIEEFYIVDNDSEDETQALLKAQKDVVSFWTNGNFVKAHCGVYWLNYILDEYEAFRWVLYVDIDEFLILPGIEKLGLLPFIARMEESGDEALFAQMLDMYPETIERGLSYKAGDDPIEFSSYFDIRHHYSGSIYSPYVLVQGGASERFSGRINIDDLTKTPLFRADRGIRLIMSSHHTIPAKLSSIKGALLHFKFLGKFLDEFSQEAERKGYPGGSERFRLFHDTFRRANMTSSLLGPDSCKYQDSSQLLDLKIICEGL